MRVQVLAEGLTFPEGPRWRGGRLWFSEFYSHGVYSLDLGGGLRREFEVPGQPSGLGWLPDGDMLVVSMRDQWVMRWDGRALSLHADLSAFARGPCNDMIVTATGRAYVGNFGFDPASEAPRSTCLVAVEPDGRAWVAAEDLAFPNGMALLDGGARLVVAESVAECLTQFDIAGDGTLANRRPFAAIPGCQPDGICADHDGSVLVTTMTCDTLVRFSGAGEHLATHSFDTHLWACAVSDAGEVLLCTADHYIAEDCRRERSGKIQIWRR